MRFLPAVLLIVAGAIPVMAGEGFRWKAEAVDEIQRPNLPESDSLGGVAWVSNNVYWAVTDEKWHPVVWELEFPMDVTTGKLNACCMKMLCRPQKANDIEGLVLDPLDGSIWLADERKGCIGQYDPKTGMRLGGAVELPAVMRGFRLDFGIESLTIGKDGLTMWTCSEEALQADGPRSTRKHGTDVRLTRLARKKGSVNWKADGQWVYRTDPIAGGPWYNTDNKECSRSGISELCLLEDGTLLVLEREFSVVLVPRLRCRLYEVDLSKATDVLRLPSVKDVSGLVRVEKRLLFETTGFAMYEGMCTGPKLADGSRLLLLVSDGDKKALRSVMALRLSSR